MAAHHRLSPSSAHRWMTCTASVQATAHIEDRGSEYADEGTLAHSLAAAMLVGDAHPEGVTDEMREYVEGYVNRIREFCAARPYHTRLVEQRLDIGEVLPGLFGTGDCVIFDGEGGGFVVDLKYGRGVPVEAEMNEQLMLYAVGAKAMAEMLGLEVSEWTLVIDQPRVREQPSSWTISAAELNEFIAEAQFAARSIKTGAVAYSPGEKTCRWCPIRGSCRARADAMMRIAQDQFGAPPPELTDEELGDLLPQLDRISAWIKDCWSHAEQRLTAGATVPGWKMVEGRSQRRWAEGAEAWLRQVLGDDAYDRSLIGLPAAEKLLKPLGMSLPADVVVKPAGKPAIAPDTDPRPAVMTATPAQDFTAVEQ